MITPISSSRPYVWKRSGKDESARACAAMPGAYLKAAFRASTSVGLVVDGSINRGCPAESMPVIEFSVDEGPFKVVPLVKTEGSYTLAIANGLEAAALHRVDVFFRASDLTQKRGNHRLRISVWRGLHATQALARASSRETKAQSHSATRSRKGSASTVFSRRGKNWT